MRWAPVLFMAAVVGLVFYFAPAEPPDPLRKCRLLIGGWHPDIPPALAERCRQAERKQQ